MFELLPVQPVVAEDPGAAQGEQAQPRSIDPAEALEHRGSHLVDVGDAADANVVDDEAGQEGAEAESPKNSDFSVISNAMFWLPDRILLTPRRERPGGGHEFVAG